MGRGLGDGRPRVVVSVAMSVDGKVALRRDHPLMHGDEAKRWEALRPPGAQAVDDARTAQLTQLYQPQAFLEGSGSLVAGTAGPLTGLPGSSGEPAGPDEPASPHEPASPDEPASSGEPAQALYTDFLPAEVVDRPGHESWFTVVDGRGRVRWTMKRANGADLLVLVARSTPAAYLAYLHGEGIPYLVAGDDGVDLAGALARMRERLAVTCVVSTGGGGINGALLRAGLVDEIQLLVLPAAIGGLGTPTVFDGPPLADGDDPARLRLLSTHAESDGALWLRYEVLREPGEPA